MTFSSPSWRSLNHFKRPLNHPKKVTKNCQVQINFICFCMLDFDWMSFCSAFFWNADLADLDVDYTQLAGRFMLMRDLWCLLAGLAIFNV